MGARGESNARREMGTVEDANEMTAKENPIVVETMGFSSNQSVFPTDQLAQSAVAITSSKVIILQFGLCATLSNSEIVATFWHL